MIFTPPAFRKQCLIALCMLLCVQSGFGIDLPGSQRDYAKGPLFGKNLYIPYLIHYNFPSLPARSGEQYDLRYHISTYFVQDIRYVEHNPLPPDGVRTYDKANVERDYESTVVEAGVSFNPLQKLQVGLDMRLIAYYAGFGDPVVEGFHRTFHFPNGGREYFLHNQLYINIPTNGGLPLFLDENTVSFGDIDLWSKMTFFEIPRLSLAFLGAFKVPTGRLDTLSGTGYPDVGFGLLSDIRAWWFLSFYAQAGVVLPLDLKSNPMFNGLAGVEIHPWNVFSFNLQMNIKTSPISGSAFYSRPQTNLLIGFTARTKNRDFNWQFYFEEDPFTNQGTDITFNLMFSHTLHAASRQ
ncbi:hypothetical protein AGMMS49940_00560 [Spirochaetia bacterium]|nr:hypothetical protein AGMMS49940_00560 [Spirochaetia bacterium]